MALIYVLVDPRDGEIRYVGLTVRTLQERYKTHICTRTPRKSHCYSWIKSVQVAGYQPIVRLVQEVPDQCGGDAEKYWISFFTESGCVLVNHTLGGEGGMLGHRHSPETRAKMSATRSGKSAPWNSEPTKRRWEAWRASGNAVSHETRQKISKAKTGRTNSKEHNEKIAAGQRGKKKSAETRAKIAATMRARRSTSDGSDQPSSSQTLAPFLPT